jgi:vanillate O-demethylase ferredoxin subunit
MVVDQVEEVREVAGEGRAQVPAAQWLETVVLARRELAQDICSFELGLPGGAPLPDFTAGAHVRVELGDGLNRAYSICSDPSERSRYVIAVLREPASRGGSAAMHDRVHVGSVLRISRPSNQFSLHEGEAHSVLMAGGIGVTPILAMARTLRRRGATFEFHYASRSRERAAFADALDAGAVGPGVQLYFDAEPAKPLDIARVLGAAAARSPNSHVYVCGPAGFIEAVRSTASRLGWPSERIHFELFGGAPAPQANTGEFEVRLVRSGISLAVPANQSVLDVLNAAGIRIDTSCEQGVCGVCVTRVLEGTPDHRDMYLTDEERERGDCFTPCCSRSKSPVLTIDL